MTPFETIFFQNMLRDLYALRWTQTGKAANCKSCQSCKLYRITSACCHIVTLCSICSLRYFEMPTPYRRFYADNVASVALPAPIYDWGASKPGTLHGLCFYWWSFNLRHLVTPSKVWEDLTAHQPIKRWTTERSAFLYFWTRSILWKYMLKAALQAYCSKQIAVLYN